MKLAMVGLGRMGANMARRLIMGGHQVVGYNRTTAVTHQLANESGLIPAVKTTDLVTQLDPPRIAWIMLPDGKTTEDMLFHLADIFAPGDILIDGGNSNFNDTIRRAKELAQKDVRFIDVGVSGGIWGLSRGYSLMVGGDAEDVEILRPILAALAPSAEQGWGWVGPSGAGHFVKMVHNGIEYGMMEAYAEGFELMNAHPDLALDLRQISNIWQHGSVVRSWLLELIARALAEDPRLESLRGWVADSGEGRWTVVEAINSDVPAPVIALSLFRRFYSRQQDGFGAKLLAAMRNQFGGHPVQKTNA